MVIDLSKLGFFIHFFGNNWNEKSIFGESATVFSIYYVTLAACRSFEHQKVIAL